MENKTENKFDLNVHTARLLMSEPFFSSLSRRINKLPTDAIPTAGVRVNPETAQFEMLYNPSYFEALSDTQKLGVLKHEFYHLIFEHVTSRRPDDVDARTWNFATDLAINSHLDGELPKGALIPGIEPFEDYQKGLSAEAYLGKLQDDENFKEDENGQGGDPKAGDPEGGDSSGGANQPQFDSHEGWDQANSTATEIAKERLKDYVKKAAEDAQRANSWGSVPIDCRKSILSRLSTFVDWRKVLRYFIKTSLRASKRSTVRKINKRFPYIHPGKKVKRQARIAISIDQSGSVSDSMLEAFFGELTTLAKLATFTVVPFDTRVDESLVYEWKKGESRKVERVMTGGTCFNAPTEYVNKNEFDGHIVLTDLMAPKPKASKCQRMWMTTKYHASHPYFQTNERIIAIDSL
tara:strand:+ start:713 stop:1933 length:1221 start_codon:yes stop_codon:yes gene_type:complete